LTPVKGTTLSRGDIMTRRFAVGHNPGDDGTLSVARMWRRWRGDNPGGGLASSVADQIRWARFHPGDGRAESGERVLPAKILHQMKEQTAGSRKLSSLCERLADDTQHDATFS